MQDCIKTVIAAYVGLLAFLLSASTSGDDWPMYGRDASHNGVSPETNPPRTWDVGGFERKTGAWLRDKARNIKWQAPLGTGTFGDPVVSGGLVWVGTNNIGPLENIIDASVLACFRETDGQPLFRYVSPRLPHGRVHDWPFAAMASSPLIEGERLWLVTNRAEVICFDIGPLLKGELQPREVWRLDMMNQLGVRPSGARMALCHTSSIASYQDWIFVITGNGVDERHDKVLAPDAPSLICLKKETGEIIWQDKSPGTEIMEGQWSSPLVLPAAGRPQIVAAQGDGWLRSFDPATGKLLWKFDINLKAYAFELGGRGTRNTFLATPVFHGGYIYIGSGQEAEHGEGPGRLVCIDPTKTGDISGELAVDAAGHAISIGRSRRLDESKGERTIVNPNSGLIWDYVQHDRNGDGKFQFEEQLHRLMGNVAIKNDLLIAVDYAGLLHCMDAQTGRVHWTYDTLAAVYSSPLIADDVVYVTDEDGDVALFRLSADPAVAMLNGNPLAEISAGNSVYCSPVFANGTLYIASRDHLFAIRDDGSLPPADWSQWRGPRRDNISAEWGLLQEWPPEGPPLVWRTDGIGQGIASTAVVGETLYTLGSSGNYEHVIALDRATGQLRWKSSIGPAVNDAPLMRWLSQRTPTVDAERLYVSTFEGHLVCLQTADGKELWRKNLVKDFAALPRIWGFVDYPLVVGERLLCTPGGGEATVAALNKRTGEVLWKTVIDPPEPGSYAAPILVERPDEFTSQYVAVLNNSLIGVRVSDGKLLWRHAAPDSNTSRASTLANHMTPVVADGSLVFPGFRIPPEMSVFQFQNKGEQIKEISRIPLRPDYFMDSTVILGDYLFTVDQTTLPMCVNWRTGETAWRTRFKGSGKIALTYADQRLYLLRGDGTMLLADASPQAFQERGQFALPDHQPAIGGTFPVITGGRMFIRDNDHLFSYDLRAAASQPPPQPRTTQLPFPPSIAGNQTVSRPLTAKKQPSAIFVPTPHDVVAKMLQLAELKAADALFDLGSGDGRIVIAAAKTYGAKAIGVELDQALIRQSRENVAAAGLAERVQIEQRDLFTRDLSDADVVAVYLPTNLMDRLLPQLTQVKAGTRIVSHFFKFTGIPPEKSLRIVSRDDGDTHEIYLWTAPLRTAK